MSTLIVFTTLFITFLAACGDRIVISERRDATLHKEEGYYFLPSGSSWMSGSALRDVRKESFRICLEGEVSEEDYKRSLEWSKEAALIWLRVLKSIDEKVTNRVEHSCDNYDLLMLLRNGNGTSFANPSRITIYMNRGFGTWTHEMGHALSNLADTYYIGGQAGVCQTGQPQSLMCWGMYGPRSNKNYYSTLWQDDVDGIIANYKSLYGSNLKAPSWSQYVDHTLPVHLDYPWPGYDSSPSRGVSSRGISNVKVNLGLPATAITDEGQDY